MPVKVRKYVRRRLTKKKRIEGMIKSARSRKTPSHLREGLQKYLDKNGIEWRK